MKVLRVRICFIYSFDLITSKPHALSGVAGRAAPTVNVHVTLSYIYARFDPALTSCCCNLCQGSGDGV